MIFVCGIPSEPPLEMVIAAAERRGLEYVLFNQRESPFTEISLEIKDGKAFGALHIRERTISLADIEGVYVRLMDYQDLPEAKPRGRRPIRDVVTKSSVLHLALLDWFEVARLRVMNRPSSMGSNASKPYQAQLIVRSGFKTPITLVTNNPDEVREFKRRHKHVIFKSISSTRSIVRELKGPYMRKIADVRHLPTQFQAYIPGVNVRVHVVGNKVFATEIVSDAIDYRYAAQEGKDAEMRPVSLPDEVSARCVTLSKHLDLPLCGIDLKLAPDGDYYCFEVNPSPAFSYYEEYTGQPIAEAIVDYLNGDGG